MKVKDISERIIIKYFEGKATQQEHRLLSDWLDQNKSNQQIFASLKKAYIETQANSMHDSSVVNEAYKKFLDHINQYEKIKASGKKMKIVYLRNLILRYAAVFVLILITGIGSYFFGYKSSSGTDNKYCEVNVPYGSRSAVILSDGSKIWLNAGSKIKYNRNFNKSLREIFLEGEAYFNVKKTNPLAS